VFDKTQGSLQAADICKTAATAANAFTNEEGVLHSIDPSIHRSIDPSLATSFQGIHQ
jgi:hypothetical protein